MKSVQKLTVFKVVLREIVNIKILPAMNSQQEQRRKDEPTGRWGCRRGLVWDPSGKLELSFRTRDEPLLAPPLFHKCYSDNTSSSNWPGA